MGEAVRAFASFLDRMQDDLGRRSWLAGDHYTLADAAALPYVMRLDHLAMTPLIDARPAVADWYARVQARPSFESAISSQLPQMLIDMFRKNGEAVWSDVEPLTRSE
jgi:glutathione S-transferase